MLLKYKDGSEADDYFFDLHEEEQRALVAQHLNCPLDPIYWPTSAINNLIGIRKTEGVRKFHDEMNRMNTPVR